MPVRAASSARQRRIHCKMRRKGKEDRLLDLPASESATLMGLLQTPQTPMLDFFDMERSAPESGP